MNSRRYQLRLRKRISVYRRTGLASILALLFLIFSFLPFNQPISNLIEPASAQAAPAFCALPGKDGVGGSPTGVINTYYPGTGTATSGATSIPVGTPSTGTAIAANDLLLVIQMQDAAIDSSNTDSYGNGVGGDVPPLTNGGIQPTNGASGFTGGTAGNYEYVVATGAVSGGSVPIKGTNSGGLINSYSSASATASQGQKTYQVVRVPQYTSASLGSATAGYWNGTASSVTTAGITIPSGTGGILAYDVAGNLTLTGTIDVSGRGFRGGAGRKLGGDGASTTLLQTDYRTPATKATNGSKGEGIAGTPRYTINPSTSLVVDNTTEGYPNGSYGRGSPGNAGGGSTDGRPSNNDQNSGGGGGSNGGYGGIGGRSWSSNLPTGGFGGKAFPATTARLVLGGGGGAGTTNDGTSSPNTNTTGINSSGTAGGGMVLIRANTVSGSGGVINANGLNALNVANDGGGGGGAGGSVLVTTLSNNLTGLTVNANGGKGGDAVFSDPHGPGGGGSGGVVVGNSGISINEAGGAPGVTGSPNQNNAAVAGSGLSIPVSLTQVPGITSGANCIPSLTVTKTTSTPTVINAPPTGAVATYTITVANSANRVAATNVTISDTLPLGFTYDASISPIVNLTSGTVAATRPTTANPADGSATPAFSNFTIPGGAIVQITFQVKIATSVANGTYQNPATATYDDPQRTVAGGTITASYNSASSTGEDVQVTAASADVVTTKTGPTTALAGSTVTYSLSTVNNGPNPALNVIITDNIGTGLSGVVASNGGIYNATTGIVTFPTIVSLANGATQTNTVSLTAPASGSITDTVSSTSTIFDPTPANNNGSSANATVTTNIFASNPNILLVKRITAVNSSKTNGSVALNTYDPDPTYPYDKNVIQPGLNPPSTNLWPNTTGASSSTFLIGARNGGTTRPGDEVEYTIYFLSAGSSVAKNTQICDRIPAYQTFVPDAFNTLTAAPNTTPASPLGDRGIAVSQGGVTYGYTNIGDGDAARYYPPGSTLPSACTQPVQTEDNGTIVVNLGDVPNATVPGTPANSYGFLRFHAKVK